MPLAFSTNDSLSFYADRRNRTTVPLPISFRPRHQLKLGYATKSQSRTCEVSCAEWQELYEAPDSLMLFL
jgi:hypothetical protein